MTDETTKEASARRPWTHPQTDWEWFHDLKREMKINRSDDADGDPNPFRDFPTNRRQIGR